MTVTQVEESAFSRTLDFFCGLRLLTDTEANEVMAMLESDFPYADAVAAAETIHLHVKVRDTNALPIDDIVARGTAAVSAKEGYVKYPFPGGINLIFSSADLPISEDDKLPNGTLGPYPVLDHKGIDLRRVDTQVRTIFDNVPAVAAPRGWREVPQGGDSPVYCCHMEVEGKHWVYPDLDDAGQRRPIEFALGPLVVHGDMMGCDLRPIDPAHPEAVKARAALQACAAAAHAESDGNTTTSATADA